MLKTPFLLIAPILLSLFLWSNLSTPNHQTIVDKVSNSIVRITGKEQGQDYVCTGFVIAKDTIMTDYHCLGDGMSADGEVMQVVKGDNYYDLAVIHGFSNKPPLQVSGRKLSRFEDLTAIGYAWGWTKLTVLTVKPFLIDFSQDGESAPGIFTQGGFVKGMSGGPTVDSYGDVVGIIQQTNSGVGFAVGGQLINAFLVGLN